MTVIRFNIISLLLFLLLCTGNVFAQDVPVRLGIALTEGSTRALAELFDERVDIVFDGEKRDYSHQQAQVVLGDFIDQFHHVTFELIHTGSTRNQSKFYIGQMTAEEAEYRVYLTVKYVNGRDYIQSIKFEKQ